MNVKKLWIAGLLGMLLVASLAGEAGARDRATVSARKYITVPAAHFNPSEDGLDWFNYGHQLNLSSGSNKAFTAPLVFPGSGPVIVRKITLYANDTNGAGDVGVVLFKMNPGAGGETEMAWAESSGRVSGIREFSDTSVTYATIQRTHGTYLWLYFDASSSLSVTGVKIVYTD